MDNDKDNEGPQLSGLGVAMVGEVLVQQDYCNLRVIVPASLLRHDYI